MKNKNVSLVIFVLLFGGILVLLMLTECIAAQFTFQVPVQLNNVNLYIEKGQVLCNIKDQNGNYMPAVGATTGGSPEFVISGGNFNSTVIVKHDVDNPWVAVKYECSLYLKHSGMAYFQPIEDLNKILGDKGFISYKWRTGGDLPIVKTSTQVP